MRLVILNLSGNPSAWWVNTVDGVSRSMKFKLDKRKEKQNGEYERMKELKIKGLQAPGTE